MPCGGGAIQFTTDANVASGFKATVDNFGRTRLLPVANLNAGPGKLLIALDATKGSTYTKQSDLERLNLFTRYSLPLANGLASVRFQAYGAEAEAPGYLDRTRVESGEIERRAFQARGIGDSKTQQNIVFNFRSNDIEGETGWGGGWFTSLYYVHDRRRRWRGGALTTPIGASVNLSQELDRLQQTGFDARKTTTFATFGLPSQLVAGVQVNSENVRAQRFLTDSAHNLVGPMVDPNTGMLTDTISVDRTVRTDTRSVYAQYQLQPFARLKLTGGLRYDHLNFKVRLRADDNTFADAQTAGVGSDINQSASQVSPKFGFGLNLYDGAQTVEFYGNAARGLKSPYAFSDFFENLTTTRTVPDLAISSLKSFEGGFQGGAKDGAFRWRASLWSTRQDKESGPNAAGIFTSFKNTQRDGFDLEGSVQVVRAVRLFANYSQVRARIKNPVNAGEDRIPNVPENIGTLGLLSDWALGVHRFDFTLATSRVGPQSITENDMQRTRAYFRTTGRLAYTQAGWKGATVFLNVVGYSRQLDETAFDFGSGRVGISPRPKLQATVGVQVPL